MTFQNARALTFPVATATVIRQRRFVTIGANGQVVEANDGEDAIGVALEASTATESQPIPVAVLDGAIIEVEAGAVINVGSAAVNIACDLDGRAITAATGDAILGTAVESATAAGQMISIFGLRLGRVA